MRNSSAHCLFPFLLAFGIVLASPAWTQTSTPKQTNPEDRMTEVPANPEFSIEAEMLTYTGLERDSEAVAKDVASFLDSTHSGVVILSSNSKALADFELWRADMAAMSSFIARDADLENMGAAGTSPTTVGPLSLTPYSAVIPLVQSLLATSESASPVRGTVEDRAFADAIARQLRVQGVSVLIPDTYMPYSLAVPDSEHFLFLRRLNQVATIRYRLLGREWPRDKIDEAGLLLADIKVFMAIVLGSEATEASDSGQSNESARSSGTADQTKVKAVPSVPFSPSRLASLLSADLLAQELGIPSGGELLLKDSRWQFILWLKALESGGSVIKTENFLRKKTRYSGGAVATYALFNMQGELECSANVYDYGGPLLAKDFGKTPRPPDLNPKNNPVVLEGSCKMLAPRGAAPSPN